MTKEETIKIMAMLGAFYGAGKSNPEVMAVGWHIILEPFKYDVAYQAVLNYVTNDTREYATFPTVGNIVVAIKDEMSRREAPFREIVRGVSYGWSYDQLSIDAQLNISRDRYDEWLKMDAEEFANTVNALTSELKESVKQLKGKSDETVEPI